MRKYDSYKDSGVEWIGEIPNSWEKTKLKFTLEGIVTGGTPDTSNDTFWGDEENGINWISISDITSNGREILETKKFISQEGLDSKRLEILPIGSLIYSIYGSIGKVSRLGIPSTIHQGILGLKTNSYLESIYLEYYLIYFKEYVSLFSSSNTQENLNQDKVSNFEIPLPPLSEQNQIVSFLDTKTSLIDSLIEKTQRKIELLKEKRTSLINEVVTKGLNPNVEMKDSGVEWIGEIPSHWFCVGTNKVYNDLGTGTTPTSDMSEYYSDNGNHWITTTDLNEGIMYDTLSKITEKSVEDYPNLRLYPSGSIYISMYGGRIGKLGVSTFDSYCNQSVCVLPKNDTIIVKFYYYWFLGFQEFVKGMGRGGGQPNINKDMIKSFPTVKIPLSEQQQIVSYLDEHTQLIDKTISIEEKRIELLKEYRQSLISEVVTGKIDVRLN
jgi:type I restriction enzyme S subunit